MLWSEENDQVAPAIVAFVAAVANPKKTETARVPTKKGGEFSYSYAALPDILDQVRPLLKEHRLACVQSVSSHEGSGDVVVITTLVHDSGQWMESEPFRLPSGNTPQEAGGSATYGRRYSLTGMLGIAADEDDDGARGGSRQQAARQDAPPKAGSSGGGNPEGGIVEGQMKAIHRVGKDVGLEHDGLHAMAVEMFGDVESMSDLTFQQASDMLDRLNAWRKEGVKPDSAYPESPPTDAYDRIAGAITNEQMVELGNLAEQLKLEHSDLAQMAANEHSVERLTELTAEQAASMIAGLQAEVAKAS